MLALAGYYYRKLKKGKGKTEIVLKIITFFSMNIRVYIMFIHYFFFPGSFNLKSPGFIALSSLIIIVCIFNMGKEIMQVCIFN